MHRSAWSDAPHDLGRTEGGWDDFESSRVVTYNLEEQVREDAARSDADGADTRQRAVTRSPDSLDGSIDIEIGGVGITVKSVHGENDRGTRSVKTGELVSVDPAKLVERAIRVAFDLPADRQAALTSMSEEEAVRLVSAALPTARRTDELVGPFYDTKGLAERWRISEQAVHKRADVARKLLKVMTKDDVALYPAFQFDAGGGMLPHLPEVWEAFSPGTTDAWTIARWLRAPSSRLGGRSPADALRAGDQARVLALASSFAERLAA